jgi:hypothetical protein
MRDRILHHATIVQIAGENYRFKAKRRARIVARPPQVCDEAVRSSCRYRQSLVSFEVPLTTINVWRGSAPLSTIAASAARCTQAAKADQPLGLRALNFTTRLRTIFSFRLPICAAWECEASSCRRKRQNPPRPNGVLSLLRRGTCRSRIKISPAGQYLGYPRPSHDFSIRPSDAEGLGDPVND